MELTDELFTPGCPNCAIKHLSTCLAFEAMSRSPLSQLDGPPCIPMKAGVLLSRAYINFVECAEGYKSHFDFAVGLLVLAEEAMVSSGNTDLALFVSTIRAIRIHAMADRDPVTAATALSEYVHPTHEAQAHLEEAIRELPTLGLKDTVDTQKAIHVIHDEYFKTLEDQEKGGEEDMATKKIVKPAAKAAAKAACKGGKCTAKKACKK